MTVLAGPHVGLVVEGPGDVRALPILLRKHLEAKGSFGDVLGKPVPLNGVGNALKKGGIESYVRVAAGRHGCLGVFVCVDSDDRDPSGLRDELEGRARSVVATPTSVAVAVRCFEDWIYASAEALRLDLTWQADSRGLKQIKDALRPEAYAKPVHQPKLTHRMDLQLARSRSNSLAAALTAFDGLTESLLSG